MIFHRLSHESGPYERPNCEASMWLSTLALCPDGTDREVLMSYIIHHRCSAVHLYSWPAACLKGHYMHQNTSLSRSCVWDNLQNSYTLLISSLSAGLTWQGRWTTPTIEWFTVHSSFHLEASHQLWLLSDLLNQLAQRVIKCLDK